MAFEINDIVVHLSGGVFTISDIKMMNYGAGDQKYYCLKSYFLNEQNEELVIYVPENKSGELIRSLMTKEEAESILNSFKSLDPIWYDNIKERKIKFAEMVSSKNLIDSCIVLKSLFLKQMYAEEDKKTLKIIDIDYLKKTKLIVLNELAVVLNKTEKEIEEEIKKMI